MACEIFFSGTSVSISSEVNLENTIASFKITCNGQSTKFKPDESGSEDRYLSTSVYTETF